MPASSNHDVLLPIGSIENAKALGQQVRAARRTVGLTQQDLADACGVGRRFISELEAGKPTARLGLALNVIQNLGLKLRIEKRDA